MQRVQGGATASGPYAAISMTEPTPGMDMTRFIGSLDLTSYATKAVHQSTFDSRVEVLMRTSSPAAASTAGHRPSATRCPAGLTTPL